MTDRKRDGAGRQVQLKPSEVAVEQLNALIETLGARPIAFIPAYALLQFGSVQSDVMCALLLSQAVYWTPKARDEDGWIYKTREEWSEETALTLKQLDGARKKLRDLGVLDEVLKDLPARLYVRVNMNRLGQLLTDGKQAFPKGQSKDSQNGKASFTKKGNQALPKRESYIRKQRLQKPENTDPENTNPENTNPKILSLSSAQQKNAARPEEMPLPDDFREYSNHRLAEITEYVAEYFDDPPSEKYVKRVLNKFIDHCRLKDKRSTDWKLEFLHYLRRGYQNGWDAKDQAS